MSQRLRIGIDFDGVICEHRDHKCRLAKERGFELEPWQTNTNVMKRHMSKDAYEALQEVLYGPLTVQAPPVSGALETLARLPGELYIVSARRRDSIRHAQEWMVRHGLYDLIPAERIHFCASSADKTGYCERLGIGVFLDDKISVLRSLPASMTRILFDDDGVAGSLDLDPGLLVANDWREFAALLVKEKTAP